MKLFDVFTPPLSFNVHPDVEGDNNRGWQLDQITAYDADGRKVGYIKFSYWPRARFLKHYPTLEAFAAEFMHEKLPTPESHPYSWKKRLKDFKLRFKEYENFYVDKPLVDFIRVEEDDNKRKGVGRALYREAFKYLAGKNMKLYASGIQSDEAKASWEKMKREGKVGTEQTKWDNKLITRQYLATF